MLINQGTTLFLVSSSVIQCGPHSSNPLISGTSDWSSKQIDRASNCNIQKNERFKSWIYSSHLVWFEENNQRGGVAFERALIPSKFIEESVGYTVKRPSLTHWNRIRGKKRQSTFTPGLFQIAKLPRLFQLNCNMLQFWGVNHKNPNNRNYFRSEKSLTWR